MTEQNTMPYEIFLSMGQETWEASVVSGDTKYIRADTLDERLKQVRDQVEFCKKHDHWPANERRRRLDKTLALIDKFLEGNK